MMKLALTTLLSWLAGLVVILASLYFVFGSADVSRADVMGFGTISFALTVLMVAIFYLPGLVWLKRRRAGVRPVTLFPLASGLALNLPAFALISYLAGKKFLASEGIIFAVALLVTGASLGLGFVWSQRAKAAAAERA
ncbi:MAG: hypothetical protein QOF61_1866 [Acidobacteriota bacterium]|jgi:hypothetical protein|nr:hypothetical protein [Acidobacteriota bacterium]